MTDQIPADKVREILDEWERIKEYADWDDLDILVKDIRALLPTPPLPTLADMTPVARRECQWMQCEVHGKRQIITLILDDSDHNYVATLDPSGYVSRCPFESVTPRPDLPRLEWPAEAPVPPNTLAEGSEWDDADALARACEESGRDQIAVLEHDGWVYVWDATDECWEGSAQPDNAPYTIIHTGFEADQ